MKFSSTVDALSKENQFLRVAVQLLVFSMLILGTAVLFLHDRRPLIVERTSRGLEILHVAESKRTESDLQDAVKLMLRARFESTAMSPDLFISKRQLELRDTEFRELKNRGITQAVVFRKASISKDEAVVEFDRIFMVGDVRSALKTTVKIAFEESQPNELNPYGLKLSMASPVEQKETK